LDKEMKSVKEEMADLWKELEAEEEDVKPPVFQ